MTTQTPRVHFRSGYSGKVSCEVEINGTRYIIELQELEEELERQILSKGFTVSQTNRQKIARLVINK